MLAAGAHGRRRGSTIDMADLAGEAAGAAMEPCRRGRRRPRRRSRPRGRRGRRCRRRRARAMEADGRGPDVVLDDARATEAGLERGPSGKSRPAEVDGEGDRARAAGRRGRGRRRRRRATSLGRGSRPSRAVDDRGDRVDRAVLGARGGRRRRGTAEDALVASTTRTAILLPPTSTPTRSGRPSPLVPAGDGTDAITPSSVVIDAPSGRARWSAAARTRRAASGPRRARRR